MINLIANSIDLGRAALDEILTHLSGTLAAPDDSDRCGEIDRLFGPGDRVGATDATVRAFPGLT